MKAFYCLLLILGFEVVFTPLGFALDAKKEPLQPTYPVLILDFKKNSENLPKHFRIISAPSPSLTSEPFVRKGLKGLQASGSAQFDNENFKHMITKINHPHIMIVDLRKESHGLLDGFPISWFGYRNWENKGKSPKEVTAIEKKLINDLNQRYHLNCKNLAKTYVKSENGTESIFTAEPILFTKMAVTEKFFVRKLGHKYSRFYVLDESPPDDIQIDKFVRLFKTLAKNTWLHFHCHDGHGRTTSFLAMYDMIHNAKKVTLQDILQRQKLMNGADLLNVTRNEPWRDTLSRERIQVLEDFYQYARDPNGYEKCSWLTWRKKAYSQKSVLAKRGRI